ncbi:MAG TPA: FhaA domain-containing protein [Ktedonobacterales bacterium]
MGIFSFVESAVRGIVQGTVQRIIPASVQEQEVLDALRQTMSDHVIYENGRQIAPHRLLARLNPHDFDGLRAKAPALDERVALDLKRIANDQGFLLKGALKVTFDRDPRVAPGRVVCEVLTDGARVAQPVGAAMTPDATQTMQADAIAAAPLAPEEPGVQIPPAWLTLLQPSRGEPMRLDRQTIRIGRHNTNDIIVNERRVSRFHAEVKYEHGQFMLYDLRSVNGVQVNGARATRPVPLQDRDIISVCGYEFIFQRR